MQREELAAWLRLGLTPGIGPGSARKLLAAFGLPPQVFDRSLGALEQVVGSTAARALHQVPPDLAGHIDATWQWLQGAEAEADVTRRIVSLGDPGYPALLLDLADPPLLLYLLGAPELELTQIRRGIAIVGSRNPTPQGEVNARAFAKSLGQAGWVVVSGLALGIDGAAHQGALDAAGDAPGLATVAVVGTGLDRVYPARHRALAHAVAKRGLIVSEFPLGTPPLAPNFPRRNRLIAALTRGTLVIEAALQSGSLVTARLAADLGREVFAVPGSIHSPQSRGCHALLRQGAKLVESVGDVLEELQQTHGPATAPATPDEDGSQDPLLRAIGLDPVGLDALMARTGWDAAHLQVKLLELELAGALARLPGGLVQRIAQA